MLLQRPPDFTAAASRAQVTWLQRGGAPCNDKYFDTFLSRRSAGAAMLFAAAEVENLFAEKYFDTLEFMSTLRSLRCCLPKHIF